MKTLCERIKKVIKDSELPLHLFAERLGIGKNTLISYRNGKTSPTVELLEKMAAEFSVDRAWLILGEGEFNRQSDALPNYRRLAENFNADINKRAREEAALLATVGEFLTKLSIIPSSLDAHKRDQIPPRPDGANDKK